MSLVKRATVISFLLWNKDKYKCKLGKCLRFRNCSTKRTRPSTRITPTLTLTGERFSKLNTLYYCRTGGKEESYHLACFAINDVPKYMSVSLASCRFSDTCQEAAPEAHHPPVAKPANFLNTHHGVKWLFSVLKRCWFCHIPDGAMLSLFWTCHTCACLPAAFWPSSISQSRKPVLSICANAVTKGVPVSLRAVPVSKAL